MGYKEEELIDQSITKILPGSSSLNLFEIDSLPENGSADGTEYKYQTKNGRQIPVLFSASTMDKNNMGIQEMVCVARDISELKTVENELREFTEKLKDRNDELQKFAYVTSHDLQEPLRKVTAFGDRLKAKYSESLGDKGLDYLERMTNAAKRMQDLINGLLSYSRVTTKARPFAVVELKAVADEVLSDLEVRINETNGRVKVDKLATLDADPLQMRQLLQNLIGNALKFHRQDIGPAITVKGSHVNGNGKRGDGRKNHGDFYQFSVEDNGIGFDEQYANRIFGVFQRLHGRNEYDGSGIGLSICKKIVERHSGSIDARSIPGHGAAFTVTLPVKQPTEEVHSE